MLSTQGELAVRRASPPSEESDNESEARTLFVEGFPVLGDGAGLGFATKEPEVKKVGLIEDRGW